MYPDITRYNLCKHRNIYRHKYHYIHSNHLDR